MFSKVIWRIILCAFFMFILVGTGYAERAKQAITIAVLPCSDVERTFKKFHPLAAYLKEQTGYDVEIRILTDFTELEWAIKNDDIDFALQDSHTYVRLEKLFKKEALMRALTREGGTSQSGALIVRKGSGIKNVGDLRGKTVMFGPKLSTTKWIAAKELFQENGIDIDKDLRAFSHGGCCEDIAFNVYLYEVDAGVVCDHFLEEHAEDKNELGVDATQLIVIGKTRSVPTRVLTARKELNSSIIARIHEALLSLDKKNPQHEKILYPAELGGFQKSRDKDYDRIRSLIGVTR